MHILVAFSCLLEYVVCCYFIFILYVHSDFACPKTIVSTSAVFVHTNPDVFPDPERFIPERWLQQDSQNLDAWLVPFSKGPRSCLGIKCVHFLV